MQVVIFEAQTVYSYGFLVYEVVIFVSIY